MYRYLITLSFVLLISFSARSQKKQTAAELIAKAAAATDSNKVKALFNVANYYAGISKLDSNKYYLSQALAVAENAGFLAGKAKALTGLGYMYMFDGKPDSALDNFLQALQIKESLHRPLEAAATREAIGRLYNNMGQPEKALAYFEEVKKVYREFNDSSHLIPVEDMIGAAYADLKDYPTAIEYFKMVMPVYERWEKTGSTIIEQPFLHNYNVGLLTNYGYCLIQTGAAKQAIAILAPLAEERKKIGGATQVVAQHFLALAYKSTGEFQKAIDNCLEAIGVLNSNPDLNLNIEAKDLHQILSECYYAVGNYKNAFDQFALFKNINDSIFNEKSDKAVAEMQAKYETEKKDKEIKTLNHEKKTQRRILLLTVIASLIASGLGIVLYRTQKLKNRVLEQKQELLKKEKAIETQALQTRMTELEQLALRAQMNPHFIFNSLNSVQHFVMKHDIEGVNSYLGAFARLIRQTLNNSARPLVTVEEEIKYLDTYLSLEKLKAGNCFSYSITADENIDTQQTLLPGMILQPFVENSIKHGISGMPGQEGRIRIHLSKPGDLLCSIEDNGIGRAAAALKKTAGTEEYESKGMQLTLSRIETFNKLYGGNIKLSIEDTANISETGSGTTVQISFPADLDQ